MSLGIGIVGLPNVGKSSLYNALTDNSALTANYPFATIEPNVGVVTVPDSRLEKLAKLYDTDKIIYADIKFIDIAGLVKGASNGEGMGNKFLSHIRECNAICHVVRAFKGNNITHVEDGINSKRDIEIINTELVLADLQTVTRRLSDLEKQNKANSKVSPELENMRQVKEILDSNQLLISSSGIDPKRIGDLHLLTMKPVIYVFNVDEETLSDGNGKKELSSLVNPQKSIFINADLESQLSGMTKQEAKELLASYGQDETGLNQLIEAAYASLGLQSYLTAGPKEVRAWTIKSGATAPEAAGVIHGDFQKGFISAEIVSFNDLVEAGSLVKAREAGKVRTEGKDYVMRPDDVVEFRFNV